MARTAADSDADFANAPRWHRALALGLDAMAAIGTVWIVVIMALIVADVAGRNFLNHPVAGVAEISARSVVAIVFLMLPAAAMKGTLIRADFLTRKVRRFSPGGLQIIETVFAIAGAVIFAIMAWSAWPDTMAAWQRSEFFGVRGVWTLPTLPFRAIIVLGALATALALLSRAQRLMLSGPSHEASQ